MLRCTFELTKRNEKENKNYLVLASACDGKDNIWINKTVLKNQDGFFKICYDIGNKGRVCLFLIGYKNSK